MKRIRLLFLMLLCVAGTALTARAQKVTLNFRNAKLEQVFGRITEQTGYTFYYARPTVNPDKVVSIAVADVDVRAALKQLLADDKVEIEIRDGKIYLSPPRQSTAVPQSVKGVVRDAAGQPVVGAAVIVKGTTRGVSSGTDGSFSFEGLADGAVLQVSALGYATAEIPVGNRSFVAVELKEDATLVDEVVVVGYGTQKKANLTGAVDQVSSELLENRPVANVTQMLQGAVPNLNISLADGKPNRSASYNIRGKTSIGAGGSALVLIDGVEGDPAMLNPNDIESVSVLKDAASAAIYGSRAPYGVVLITTKDPGKLTDKFTINYTGNVSIQQPTAIPDVVDDGYVYSRLFYDAWYNYRFNEPTGFNNSQDFSRAWLDTFRQRKLAGNKLETTVEPDGKYVYYGKGKLYATYNGIETSIDIVINEPQGLTLRLDSVINDGLYEYPIEVTAIVNGESMLISPDAFSWTVQDPTICTVTEGLLKGIANGKTDIYCRQDNFTDTLSVTVQIPDRRNRAIDDFSDASSWDITNSALKDISIVPTAQGTELRYTFSSGRAPYLQIAKDIYLYSLPDSMRITLNTGATQVSKIALSMKNNASSTSTLTEFENIPQNTDHVISIPMNGYFENYRDMSLYPVKFQSLKLFILGSSQTAGNPYTIALKEFSLIYDGITVNVSNPEIASLLRVYPNPVEAGASQIHFVLPQNADVNCELYNLGGQLLNRVEMGQTPAGEITLPIGNLANGTYLLKIYRNGIADSVKIIVK